MPADVRHGDCLDVMRGMADSSVHAIITDPPYGLAEHKRANVEKALLAWLTGDREHVPDGKGFMGRQWDAFVPPPAVWDECFRVLKPGGHLLAFCGSRTIDLMMMSIRLAGLTEAAAPEIRDSIAWLYGSGFPKSLDVGKAIDKTRDEDAVPRRLVCAQLRSALVASGKTRRAIDDHFGTANVSQYWFSPDRNSQVPPVDKWPWVRDFLGIGPALDAEVWRLNGRKGAPGEAWGQREVLGRSDELLGRKSGIGNGTAGHHTVGGTRAEAYDVTAPATPAAREWAGWGTALKPAFEPVVVARKPLVGSVAGNVQEWGCGALNIDACRVGGNVDEMRGRSGTSAIPGGDTSSYRAHNAGGGVWEPASAGRWPANVVLDGSQADALDQQSGNLTSGGGDRGSTARRGGIMGVDSDASRPTPYAREADSGGASRFFPTFRYQAKAPTSERPTYTTADGRKVAHPTVKPLGLMRWLVKLVTPTGGTVLDPFAGSGATVEACLIEGFDCIAIERDSESLPLIQQRIDRQAGTLPFDRPA